MTGMEPAAGLAAARAAGKLAEGALTDSQSTNEKLLEAAKDTPEFQEAAELRARRLAAKEAVLLDLYRPLGWIFPRARKYFDEKFIPDLAEKTADIPDEDLIEPQPVVAGPALEGLAYSLDEPSLKEMYLNLLARASDGRSASKAHPSFPEIIKQLSPDEATLLNWVLRGSTYTLAQLVVRREDNSAYTIVGKSAYTILQQHLVPWVDVETQEPVWDPMIPTWIDNWVRLGLVTVDYTIFLTSENEYRWLEGPGFTRLLSSEVEGQTRSFQKGVMRVTDFGRTFGEVVTPPPAPPGPSEAEPASSS